MPNLVTVTKEGRLFLKVGGVIFGVGFLIYLIFQGGSLIQSVFFPKPPPPPKQAHGKLPHIEFPSGGEQGINFSVNTISGNLPKLPDRVNVYPLIQPEPDLLALESARRVLEREGFVDNQIKLSDTLYQWSQSRRGVVIQYDIVTKSFSISSDYLNNPILISQNSLPNDKSIKDDVRSFISSMSNKSGNIDFSKTSVTYLEYLNGTLVPPDNQTNARFARITLHQQDVDKIPIIYDTPLDSILTFLVSYPNGRFQILEGSYYNHDPNLEDGSDYPIKTSTAAFEDLKSGNAYMINPKNLTDIQITKVELKYYLSKNSSQFLLPVIVFTGIDFTGYVEAIPSTSLN